MEEWQLEHKMNQLVFKFPFKKNIMNKTIMSQVIIFLLIN